MEPTTQAPEVQAPGPVEVKKTVGALGPNAESYVRLMAHNLGITVTPALIAECAELTTAETNRKLFAMHKEAPAPVAIDIKKEWLSNLAIMGKARIHDMVRHASAELQNSIHRLRDYNASMVAEAACVAEAKVKLEALQKGDAASIDFAAQVHEVLKNPFYELYDVSQTHLDFLTKTVIMRYKRASTKEDMTVDLGRFKVRIKPTEGRATIHAYQDNVAINGYPHPHIQSGGTLCWGNAASALNEMASTFNFVKLMGVLEAFLHSYNPDSPYVELYRFDDQRKEEKERAERLKAFKYARLRLQGLWVTAEQVEQSTSHRTFIMRTRARNMRDGRFMAIIDRLYRNNPTSEYLIIPCEYVNVAGRGQYMLIKLIDGSYLAWDDVFNQGYDVIEETAQTSNIPKDERRAQNLIRIGERNYPAIPAVEILRAYIEADPSMSINAARDCITGGLSNEQFATYVADNYGAGSTNTPQQDTSLEDDDDDSSDDGDDDGDYDYEDEE